jgi:hypothetical protein
VTTGTALYVMNPATDRVIFGDQLAEGMWVMPESECLRRGRSEDAALRANRFCRVTALRWPPSPGSGYPAKVAFIGEWVDGYQSACCYAVTWGWIVRRDDEPGEAAEHAAGTDAP